MDLPRKDSMLFAVMQKTGIEITPEEVTGLIFEKRTYNKDECLTRKGTIENYFYYIKNGSVKVTYFNGNMEYILDFWFENEIISSFPSLIEQSPSELELRAITTTEVERINYQQLKEYYQKSHKVSEIGRKLTEHIYLNKVKKQMNLLSLTAEERYELLLQKSKRLIQEIPVKDIASYLGIKSESLSRIRRKIKKPA